MRAKSLLRDLVVSVLLRTRYASRASLLRSGLVVLTFHRVLPDALRREYPLRQLAVTPEELDWIIGELQEHFTVGTLTGSLRRLGSPGAAPGLAITFDDGQWDNFAYAAPVLARRGVPASFYIPTDFVGSQQVLWHDEVAFRWRQDRDAVIRIVRPAGWAASVVSLGHLLEWMKQLQSAVRGALMEKLRELPCRIPDWGRLMTWEELDTLRRAGHEIGSHARSHDLLPTMTRQGQEAEILGSREVIARRLGVEASSLCYPNGSFDDVSVEAARAAGYDYAVTTAAGLYRPGDNPYAIPRHDMDAARLRDASGALSASLLWYRLLRSARSAA